MEIIYYNIHYSIYNLVVGAIKRYEMVKVNIQIFLFLISVVQWE